MLVTAIGVLAILCMGCTKDPETISTTAVPNYPAPRKPIVSTNSFFSELHLPPGLGSDTKAASINPEVAKQGPELDQKLRPQFSVPGKKARPTQRAKSVKAKAKKRKKR